MFISSDLICKYGFKSTVKDDRVFYVFYSGHSRFSGWKFPAVWPGDVREVLEREAWITLLSLAVIISFL